ncbi:helix-turn-helix transcriptional regulator [Litoribacter ruber]|uniref:helix-turn-helix domain-containing protein n=1 Tax=Litoribacter ruber TaxID=702568 RepID=UPI001BDB0F1E|nr:AraC family transcriptional regulator [Litoribacter ruber]MBT0811596.1 helix-turn-helix transcriptional regulator [Litoribacter ruber]
MTSKGKIENQFLTLLDAEEGNGEVTGYTINPFFKERKGESAQFYEYLSEKIYFAHWSTIKGLESPMLTYPHPNYVQLNFCLKGHIDYVDHTGLEVFSNTKGFQNILYKGLEELNVRIVDPAELLIIYLRKDFFLDYSHLDHNNGEAFWKNVSLKKYASLSRRNLPISNRMASIIQLLINSQECDGFKKNLVDARIIELLTLQLDAFQRSMILQAGTTLKDEEITQMEEARTCLISRLDISITLKELAHQVGTNEFNLKKHFKMVFGKTVFAYLFEYKMEKAHDKLIQTSAPIAEIALELGYKHATHFSAAFKRHYGYLPKELRL